MPEGRFSGPRIGTEGKIKVTLSWGKFFNSNSEAEDFLDAYEQRFDLDQALDEIESRTTLDISSASERFGTDGEAGNQAIGDFEIQTENNKLFTNPYSQNTNGLGDIMIALCKQFGLLGYGYDEEEQLRKGCPIKFIQFDTVPQGIWLERNRPAAVSPIKLRYPLSDDAILNPEDYETIRTVVQNFYEETDGPEVKVNFEGLEIHVILNDDMERLRNIGQLNFQLQTLMDDEIPNAGLRTEYPVLEAL